ncbi:hypothetical protein KAU11_00730 [Candidatus Babeliales bacterium]|nr:hypothetical protein [Candidatus Babeliales bacterium]
MNKKLFLLFLSIASFSNLGAWKTRGHWLLSDGEIIGGTALAGIGAGGLGALLAYGSIRDEDGSRGSPLVGGLVCAIPVAIFTYWKIRNLTAKKKCEAASERIAKLLENEIVFPLETKEKIDVSEDIEKHFVDEQYPLLSAKKYLDDMSRGMENASSLAMAVAEYTDQVINVKKMESKNLRELLELCAAGPECEIGEEYLTALKVGAKRIRPIVKKILLVLAKDSRFEDQRRNFNRDQQHQREMELLRERNDISRESNRIKREKNRRRRRGSFFDEW